MSFMDDDDLHIEDPEIEVEVEYLGHTSDIIRIRSLETGKEGHVTKFQVLDYSLKSGDYELNDWSELETIILKKSLAFEKGLITDE